MLQEKIRKILNEEITVNYMGDLEGVSDAVGRLNDLFQAAAEEIMKAATSKKLDIYDESRARNAVKKIDIYPQKEEPEEVDWEDFSNT